MNYREKIRKAIECPQFRNKDYGEWGALNLQQRMLIKRLLNELDSAENCIKKLYLKNIKQKEVIDKITDLIKQYGKYDGEKCTRGFQMWNADFNKILDMLKEVSE